MARFKQHVSRMSFQTCSNPFWAPTPACFYPISRIAAEAGARSQSLHKVHPLHVHCPLSGNCDLSASPYIQHSHRDAGQLPRQSCWPLFANFAVRCSFYGTFFVPPAAAVAAVLLHNSAASFHSLRPSSLSLYCYTLSPSHPLSLSRAHSFAFAAHLRGQRRLAAAFCNAKCFA